MVKAPVWAPGEVGFILGSATGFLCHLAEITLLSSLSHEASYCEVRFRPVKSPHDQQKTGAMEVILHVCMYIYIYI